MDVAIFYLKGRSMGYYTRYNLTATEWPEELTNYLRSNEDDFYPIEEDGTLKDSATWYNHEKYILELSKVFPEIRFTLSGEGEDNEDIWEKHFLNGKMQLCKAQITIPPFDMEKLQ